MKEVEMKEVKDNLQHRLEIASVGQPKADRSLETEKSL